MTKTKQKRSAGGYTDPLAELIAFCATRLGGYEGVKECYETLAGEPVEMRQIKRWLDPDKAKRHEPLLSKGLILLSAGEMCIREMGGPGLPTTRKAA